MTEDPESEELEILLLKLVQSAVARQPKTREVAVLHVSDPAALLRPEPNNEVK
jgi:hypothetical protein